MASQLSLDRIEFKVVNIRCNLKAQCERDPTFPQAKVDFSTYTSMHRTALVYDPATAEDPRNFALSYGVKMESPSEQLMPYEIEVEAVAFMQYDGDELTGAERFRAVRMSGYQIIHGAIREMIVNVTARARHGALQLPSRNFNAQAKMDAENDEQMRQQHLESVLPKAAELPSQKLVASTRKEEKQQTHP